MDKHGDKLASVQHDVAELKTLPMRVAKLETLVDDLRIARWKLWGGATFLGGAGALVMSALGFLAKFLHNIFPA